MAEYIERGALLERMEARLKQLRDEYGDYDHYTDGFDEGLLAVEDADAADVVEVRHGEWKIGSEIHRMLDDFDEEFFVECPFCHRQYYVPYLFDDEKILEYAREKYPYCNCGAKMDGKGEG